MQCDKSPEELIDLLKQHMQDIAHLVEGIDERNWRARPMPEEWSATEIACHLRDVEREVNLPRLHRLAEENFPFFAPADTDALVQRRQYQEQNGPEAVLAWQAARQKLCADLANLPPDVWQRQARHSLFGPTTLQELVCLMVDHDEAHIKQLQETIQAYREQ